MTNQISPEIPVPPALAAILAHHQTELVASGHSPEIAKRMAERMAYHAGWFRTKKGWKQLSKDLSDKVNVRHADQQPDGTYLVRDVDAFYPNAVKQAMEIAPDGTLTQAGTKQYKRDDILAMIENTNRGIHAGGQKPALTRGHPNAQQKSIGISLPSHGHCFNWRESPRGQGWARCDIASIDPEIYADWRDRKITGLSAGIVQDAGGLNRRFGHVAALGAESQALSALPTTEVFSVADQVCFSAEPAAFSGPGKKFPKLKGATKMKMTPKQAGALKDCYSAYAAALSSYEAGEPESEGKMEEAMKAMKAKHTEFGAEMPPEMPGTSPASPAPAEPVAPLATTGGTQEIPGEYEAESGPDFSTDPEGAFAAQQRNFAKLIKHQRAMSAKLVSSENQTKLLKAKIAIDQFSAELGKLTAAGHQFESDLYIENFATAHGDPAVAAKLLERARKSPKAITPASVGAIFGNQGDKVDTFSAKTLAEESAELSAEFGADFTAAYGMLGAGTVIPGARR